MRVGYGPGVCNRGGWIARMRPRPYLLLCGRASPLRTTQPEEHVSRAQHRQSDAGLPPIPFSR